MSAHKLLPQTRPLAAGQIQIRRRAANEMIALNAIEGAPVSERVTRLVNQYVEGKISREEYFAAALPKRRS